MNLHQLQATYNPEEDRILFRVSFRDQQAPLQEVRAWLTRRLLVNLWPGVIKALKTQVALDQPLAAHAKDEIMNMEHLASLTEINARGDFNVPFETGEQAYPQDGRPGIVTSVNIHLAANEAARVVFIAGEKMEFEVRFMKTEFHGFCMMLQDCIKLADWGIGPLLAGMEEIDAGPRVLN
ncbi:MAG: hypothetical protein H7315_16805 [Herminiimonas sp.]|nr:hypothetical protein [Herminiimonas sp.]